MRRLITPGLLLCHVSCLLRGTAFVQRCNAFHDKLRKFFQNCTSQKHAVRAASGTEKLSIPFSSSYSNTTGIVSNTKYEVLGFNFQATIAAAKIACPTLSEKLQLIKTGSSERINYLITQPNPAGKRPKPYIQAGI